MDRRSIFRRLANRSAELDRSSVFLIDAPHAIASFTFDDFPASAVEQGLRILDNYGAKATYYVSGEHVDQTLGSVKYCESAQLRHLLSSGHEIGCHGYLHTSHCGLSARDVSDNCAHNEQFLQSRLGIDFRTTSFGYPFGDASYFSKRVVGRRFDICRGVQLGVNAREVDFSMLRVLPLEQYRLDEYSLEDSIAEALENNGWIVFLTHDVSTNPSPYGCTPEQLERALSLVTNAKIPIKTISEAAKIMRPRSMV